MEIEKIKVNELKKANYNPRLMPKSEMKKLKNSIKEFGVVDPIIINLKNNTIIGGHQRFEALAELDSEDEWHLLKLGDVGWVFPDTDLKIENESHEKALNIALNRISGEWDYEKLNEVLTELEDSDYDTALTGFDDEEIEEIAEELGLIDEEIDEDDKYVKDKKIIQYEPNGEEPSIEELFNKEKYEEFVEELENAEIDEEIKKFLMLGATRHISFNFSNIAEFYCHQSKEVQEFMEKQALVFIDYEDAIELGYAEFIENLVDDLEAQ